MKKFKKYPFILLITVSLVLFAGYRMVILPLQHNGKEDGTEIKTVSKMQERHNLPTPKKVEKVETQKKATTPKKEKPKKTQPSDTPTEAMTPPEPAVEEPNVNLPAEEPVVNPPAEEPAVNPPVEEPAVNPPVEEPAVNPPVEEPAVNPPVTVPPENSGNRQFHRVEMDYLDNALFIGDSRTSTLYEYAGWSATDFFVKYGLTIWDIWDNNMDGNTLEGMLTQKQYGKIYIMLGINELGSGTPDSFAQQYQAVLARIQELQPGAVIFLQAIMHVSANKDAQNTYINNGEVNARNEALRVLGNNETIFYIDVNEVMDAPGAGTLNEEYSFDGVHLKVKNIDLWREFLLNHGI